LNLLGTIINREKNNQPNKRTHRKKFNAANKKISKHKYKNKKVKLSKIQFWHGGVIVACNYYSVAAWMLNNGYFTKLLQENEDNLLFHKINLFFFSFFMISLTFRGNSKIDYWKTHWSNLLFLLQMQDV